MNDAEYKKVREFYRKRNMTEKYSLLHEIEEIIKMEKSDNKQLREYFQNTLKAQERSENTLKNSQEQSLLDTL